MLRAGAETGPYAVEASPGAATTKTAGDKLAGVPGELSLPRFVGS